MHPPTSLLVILPLSHILFSDICPVHSTHATLHILTPLSLEVISRRVVIHLPVSVLHIIFKITFKHTPTLESDFSFALFFTLKPLSFVSCVIDHVFTEAMSQPVFYLSFISTSIWPFVVAFSCDSIISKLSFINYAVGPNKNSFSVQESIIKFSLVFVAVLEGHFGWTIQTFTVNLAVLRRSGYLSLPILIEDLCELDREHHSIAHFFYKL